MFHSFIIRLKNSSANTNYVGKRRTNICSFSTRFLPSPHPDWRGRLEKENFQVFVPFLHHFQVAVGIMMIKNKRREEQRRIKSFFRRTWNFEIHGEIFLARISARDRLSRTDNFNYFQSHFGLAADWNKLNLIYQLFSFLHGNVSSFKFWVVEPSWWHRKVFHSSIWNVLRKFSVFLSFECRLPFSGTCHESRDSPPVVVVYGENNCKYLELPESSKFSSNSLTDFNFSTFCVQIWDTLKLEGTKLSKISSSRLCSSLFVAAQRVASQHSLITVKCSQFKIVRVRGKAVMNFPNEICGMGEMRVQKFQLIIISNFLKIHKEVKIWGSDKTSSRCKASPLCKAFCTSFECWKRGNEIPRIWVALIPLQFSTDKLSTTRNKLDDDKFKAKKIRSLLCCTLRFHVLLLKLNPEKCRTNCCSFHG